MKFRKARKYLKDQGLDALVLLNKSPNFKYFIGSDFDHGMMFITKKANYLLLSPLYAPRIKGFKVINWNDFKKDIKLFIKKHNIIRAGADYSNLLVKQKTFLRKHFKLIDSSELLEGLRQEKDSYELANIKKACKITDKIFSLVINNFSKFKTEKDVSDFIKIKAVEMAEGVSFEPIVASGKNSVVAHHEPGAKLRKGFLIMDFGVKYKGYLSDMTRTAYIGKPGKEELRIYNKVLEIQEKCVLKARKGMKAKDLYDYSIKLFGQEAKHFIHGLGHGIGVEIHEKPSLAKSDDVLGENNVFTIEPGYYDKDKGIGVRIEDDILLSGNNKQVLTKSTKKLICLKN